MTPSPTETAIAALELAASVIRNADCKNGVEHQGLDEGDVIAGTCLGEITDAITALRAPVAGDWVCVPRTAQAVIDEAKKLVDTMVRGEKWDTLALHKALYAHADAPPPAAGGMKAEGAKELAATILAEGDDGRKSR